MAMIIDGKTLAAERCARIHARIAQIGYTPRMVAVVANDTPATRAYLKIKEQTAQQAGWQFDVQTFPPATVSEYELTANVIDGTLADALIVQLPLPKQLNQERVLDALSLRLDADVLSSEARKRFVEGRPGALLPPVVAAVAEILAAGGISPRGKRAVVLGSGYLVGEPVYEWLLQQGADCAAYDEHDSRMDISVALAAAEIVVSGVGKPGFVIRPGMLREGVALIDAAGDADPACESKCSLFTPRKGGVGPIAVAHLFENATALLAERRQAA